MTLVSVLVCLAAWRLARLVSVDRIAKPVRRWIAGTPDTWIDNVKLDAGEIDRDGLPFDDRPTLGYLVTCPWCVSIYVTPPLALVAVSTLTDLDWGDRVAMAFLLTLVGSLAAGIGQTVEDRLDR